MGRSDRSLACSAEAEIKGSCLALRQAVALAKRAGQVGLPVLIQGETGTGKEAMARVVHEASGRGSELVAVNCSTLSPQLVESELFGHRRGAFTGASEDRAGLFEAANGGSIFLDEVGELRDGAQAQLLRVLQEGSIRRLGESRPRPVDVRIIAATHRDLEAMVADGAFREDLYYRLADVVVQLPPLRERGSDVVVLARHFVRSDPGIARIGRFTLGRDAASRLTLERWPGNVRQLRSTLRRAALSCRGARIGVEDIERVLGPRVRGRAPARSPDEAVLDALEEGREVTWSELTRQTGLSRGTLQRALERLRCEGRLRRLGRGRGTRYTAPVSESIAGLDERARRVLTLATRAPVRRSAVAQSLGISARSASRLLAELADRGLIEALGGGGRSQCYRRTAEP